MTEIKSNIRYIKFEIFIINPLDAGVRCGDTRHFPASLQFRQKFSKFKCSLPNMGPGLLELFFDRVCGPRSETSTHI